METNTERFDRAAAVLPVRLRRLALALPEKDRAEAEEIRLRAGQNLSVLLPQGEKELDAIVEVQELETLCDLATDFSRYAAVETLRRGFISVSGGFRVGLCGTAVIKDGKNTNLKDISSAAIRIGREHKGVGKEVAAGLFRDGR